MQFGEYLDRREHLETVRDVLEVKLAYLEFFYKNGDGLEEIGRVMTKIMSVKDEIDELDYIWAASGGSIAQVISGYPAWMVDCI